MPTSCRLSKDSSTALLRPSPSEQTSYRPQQPVLANNMSQNRGAPSTKGHNNVQGKNQVSGQKHPTGDILKKKTVVRKVKNTAGNGNTGGANGNTAHPDGNTRGANANTGAGIPSTMTAANANGVATPRTPNASGRPPVRTQGMAIPSPLVGRRPARPPTSTTNSSQSPLPPAQRAPGHPAHPASVTVPPATPIAN